jgi:nucleotide-binding universal stress UspA family protein
MTVALVGAALLLGTIVGLSVPHAKRPAQPSPRQSSTPHILLPFTPHTLSRRALDAAIRLAKVEEATLMPAFLATVPLTLSLESPIPGQFRVGMPLLEAVEQRAAAHDVTIDSRVQGGRSYRQALARLLEHEQFERVVISAGDNLQTGLSGADLLWLLAHTNAEVMILRPAPGDASVITDEKLRGHF